MCKTGVDWGLRQAYRSRLRAAQLAASATEQSSKLIHFEFARGMDRCREWVMNEGRRSMYREGRRIFQDRNGGVVVAGELGETEIELSL